MWTNTVKVNRQTGLMTKAASKIRRNIPSAFRAIQHECGICITPDYMNYKFPEASVELTCTVHIFY